MTNKLLATTFEKKCTLLEILPIIISIPLVDFSSFISAPIICTKNTINITNQHFLDNKILIPENGWLEIIVNAASTIEKMIQIECNAQLCLERQKNYLLSKMFI